MHLGCILNTIFLNIKDVAVIALTTDVIFLFFIKQLQPSFQLWQQFLHENALFFSPSKRRLHLQNPQLNFSSLPLSCHDWTSSYPGRIARSSYSCIFSQIAIYFQSYLVNHTNTSVNQEIAHIYQADFSVTKEKLLNVNNSLHMANLKQWELKYYRIWYFILCRNLEISTRKLKRKILPSRVGISVPQRIYG